MALGYLVPEFPSQTHTFFWREVQALRAAGALVVLFSTTRPAVGSCRHEFAETAASETTYLFPASLPDLIYLIRRPRGILSAFRYVFGLKESAIGQRFLLLGLIASAARLCLVARGKGISHVHIHSCANAAHIGALARLLDGLTYSLTLHGDLEIYGTDHCAKMREASFVSCVTRPLQDQVVTVASVPRQKVPVLSMGVDMSRFSKAAGRSGIPGTLRAISVARLTWPKGHEFALRALRQSKESGVSFHYKIVGEGPYRPQIEAEVRALGLTDQVDFLGTMSEADVAKELAVSDVLLLPSFKLGEAAPVAVMEAMASGLPVIASIIGGTLDMISDGVDGFLVPQEDVNAIAACLKRLAADVSLRERIGTAARERATRQFDSKVLAIRLLALIGANGCASGSDATIPSSRTPLLDPEGGARLDRKVIGYLVPEFPGQTHNFFWREIEQLKEIGVDVELISTKPPATQPLTTGWGAEAAARTTYLHPMKAREAVVLFPLLIRGVAGNLRSVKEILQEAWGLGARRFIRTLLLFPYGAKLARACRTKGLSHVHVHSCADALTIAMIARRLGGPSYGMTLHNPLWVFGPGQGLKWQSATYAIVITKALEKAVLQELGSAVPRSLAVAPMGVDCEVFKRTDAFTPFQGTGEFRIACCARLNVGKGHLELISSVRKLRDAGMNVTLTIAGEDDQGGRGFRKRVESHIAALGLQRQVQLLGAVPERVVVDLLSRAHVFALASYDEPLGVAIMEAMAMELPVVIARSEGVCELVEDGVQGILTEPQDVDAFSQALDFISRNPAVAQSFGRHGRERVRALFSTARSARVIQGFL